MSKMQIPSITWSALLVGLAAVIQTNFEGATWYNLALIIIAGLIKGMDVGFDKILSDLSGRTEPDPPPAQTRGIAGSVSGRPSALRRWLL